MHTPPTHTQKALTWYMRKYLQMLMTQADSPAAALLLLLMLSGRKPGLDM